MHVGLYYDLVGDHFGVTVVAQGYYSQFMLFLFINISVKILMFHIIILLCCEPYVMTTPSSPSILIQIVVSIPFSTEIFF